MHKHVIDDDVPLVYNRRLREYGLKILDGGTAVQTIGYCPWCGKKLPPSLRDVWYKRLEQLGLEPGDPAIPEEMRNDSWWKALGL